MASTPEHPLAAIARDLARTSFAARAAKWDVTEQYCWENIPELVDARLMGMTIPKEHGGQGASFYDAVLAIEEIAKVCALTARVVVEANMGAISAIMAYGSPKQKQLAASYVLAGDKPAICITEPRAGSAATEMTTTARKAGNSFILNGRKHWITGGGVSKLHLIFARVADEEGVEQGIGGFLVLRDPENGIAPEGFRIVRRESTMGLRGMPEAELSFEDLEVEQDMVLMPPCGFRRGFADLMNAYNRDRKSVV